MIRIYGGLVKNAGHDWTEFPTLQEFTDAEISQMKHGQKVIIWCGGMQGEATLEVKEGQPIQARIHWKTVVETHKPEKNTMYLGWDYSADPLWDDRGNIDFDGYCDRHGIDARLKEEILSWYEKFSRVEDFLHYEIRKKRSDYREPKMDEIGRVLIELKEIIPIGEELARRLGVRSLRVDYGHDPRLKELEFKILGESDLLREWWKIQEEHQK